MVFDALSLVQSVFLLIVGSDDQTSTWLEGDLEEPADEIRLPGGWYVLEASPDKVEEDWAEYAVNSGHGGQHPVIRSEMLCRWRAHLGDGVQLAGECLCFAGSVESIAAFFQ